MRNEKKLIINADGFGFTPGVNKGIVESIRNGVVTSISCVVNFPFIEEIARFKQEFGERNISIGIHFNLSVGKPVSDISKVSTLIDSNTGEFWGDSLLKKCLRNEISSREIEFELENQVKVLLDLGIKPTHWDGHQNKHLYPKFFTAAMSVAKKYNILKMRTHRRYIFLQNPKNRWLKVFKYYLKDPVRLASHSYARFLMVIATLNGFRMADRLITPAYADESKKFFMETWLSIIKYLPKGVNEIYCHPGYPDEVLKKYAKYVYEREYEIKILTSNKLKDAILESNIKLISFRDL